MITGHSHQAVGNHRTVLAEERIRNATETEVRNITGVDGEKNGSWGSKE